MEPVRKFDVTLAISRGDNDGTYHEAVDLVRQVKPEWKDTELTAKVHTCICMHIQLYLKYMPSFFYFS